MLDDLQNVMSDRYIKYSGCLIEKVRDKRGKIVGFARNGRKYDTLLEAYADIDNTFANMAKSIRQ